MRNEERSLAATRTQPEATEPGIARQRMLTSFAYLAISSSVGRT
jgi:hypothetical protein